jgi:hypothetical protein
MGFESSQWLSITRRRRLLSFPPKPPAVSETPPEFLRHTPRPRRFPRTAPRCSERSRRRAEAGASVLYGQEIKAKGARYWQQSISGAVRRYDHTNSRRSRCHQAADVGLAQVSLEAQLASSRDDPRIDRRPELCSAPHRPQRIDLLLAGDNRVAGGARWFPPRSIDARRHPVRSVGVFSTLISVELKFKNRPNRRRLPM